MDIKCLSSEKAEKHEGQISLLGLESEMFPSITFCNVNPYKKSKIEMVPALKALMDVYELSASGSLSSGS
ncbi:unnamed protein product [Strongylus vulgaris]|uniref:Uncharacterized protein n=1 Tax=Strongylus vulgaris TaxID=40348 RepID=A0A3P7K8Y0_STRVU|nr:unnamed protein product [Strongylus vulgaris]